MKIGRDWRHLLPALLLSLALHLLFGYGLNVYGNGPATAKVPTRLTLRLARPPRPVELQQPQPPGQNPAVALPVAPIERSPLALPVGKQDPAPAPGATVDTPEVPVSSPDAPVALPEAPLPQMPTLGLIEMPDLRYLPADEVDMVARPVSAVAPNFPLKLQDSNLSGMVIIRLKIDENGVVVSGEIEYAEPEGLFDQSALVPFIQARYSPAQKNGLPVRSEKRIEIIFGDYQRPLAGPPLPPSAP